jgi:hypothetical protein
VPYIDQELSGAVLSLSTTAVLHPSIARAQGSVVVCLGYGPIVDARISKQISQRRRAQTRHGGAWIAHSINWSLETMQRTKSAHRVGAPHRSLATADASLNDDSAEKRQRRDERVANKQLERQKVVAAAHASPKRSNNSAAAPSTPPRTPNGTVLQTVEADPHTPVRKVPILANFEEWMKMATDNVYFSCLC